MLRYFNRFFVGISTHRRFGHRNIGHRNKSHRNIGMTPTGRVRHAEPTHGNWWWFIQYIHMVLVQFFLEHTPFLQLTIWLVGWSSVRARLTNSGRISGREDGGRPLSPSPSFAATTSRARRLMLGFLLASRLPTELRKIWAGRRERQLSSTFSA
jgi:hypothetical protein